ncbi:MAG: hypothetical protein D6791_14300 [Chloroflexi bacterium]|nr:MAG: hypothetical protein D6791_14300 [Chloroflexota bacterium]
MPNGFPTTTARFSFRQLLAAALFLATLLLSGCSIGPIIANAEIEPATISPNADGDSDVARIAYTIRRPGYVSIYFVDENGQAHYFRKERRRAARDYTVFWGGVIDGRVLPDGQYTWVIEARDDNGQTEKVEGPLTIVDADTTPPEFHNFAVNPAVITPNQDGIDDRASITYWLTKEVSEIQVYLLNPNDPDNPNRKYHLAETQREVEPTEPGYHWYDYDGGVDQGADPPPDGDYIVVAEAWDFVGNHTVVTSTLTIRNGGKPRAEIVQGEVTMLDPMDGDLNIPIGGALVFTATVENYGKVPIRTAGPWPGTVYRSDENFNTLAYREGENSWFEQSGTWRFGLNYQSNFGQDWPFRYAVGRRQDLRCEIIDGREQCFLDPGKRGLVYGTIIWVDVPPRNPFRIWGGLLHEDVEIVNNFADVQEVEILDPRQTP